MKKTSIRIYILILLGLFFCIPLPSLATSLIDRIEGRIVLQTQEHGEAWYINPINHYRYYLGRPDDAFAIMQNLGTGITNANLELIPTETQNWSADMSILNYVRGHILLQVEAHGEAWYVSPYTGKRYYLGRPDDAFQIMTEHGLGITNADLEQIPIGIPGESIPTSVNINVPFTSQAPLGNWGSPFSEACEEAILVMLSHYYKGTGFSANDAQSEILRIVDWEMNTYGHHEDTSADETARTAREVYGLNATVSYDVSEDRIKQLLTEHKLVIAPVYGKYLYNPHFKNGGPYYHMILITGYEGNDFITHDPGTRYGENYRYSIDVMMNAIHDLASPESNGYNSPPAIVIVE